MLKKIFGSKDHFYSEFEKELSETSPLYLSIDLNENTLKTVWKKEDADQIGIELTQAHHFLTNSKGRTIKLKALTPFKDLVTSHTRRVLLEKIEQAKEILHLFPNISTPTEGELKGEEWLKVTNHVLKESLKKAQLDDSLSVSAKIFIGIQDASREEFNMRIQCYNLDYSLTFLVNGKLFLSVFDDKNFERGFSERPSYSGEFYNNRPMILDEFIKLLHEILSRSNIKIF